MTKDPREKSISSNIKFVPNITGPINLWTMRSSRLPNQISINLLFINIFPKDSVILREIKGRGNKIAGPSLEIKAVVMLRRRQHPLARDYLPQLKIYLLIILLARNKR